MSQQKKEDLFIEECALIFEKMGPFPKISGKIFSYLLVCEPHYQSANQLIERLGVAKSSISNAIHMLVRVDLVEEISLPGERSRYYQLKLDGWESLMFKKMQAISTLRAVFAKGYEVIPKKNKSAQNRLDTINHLYAFFEDEMAGMDKRWEAYKKKHKLL